MLCYRLEGHKCKSSLHYEIVDRNLVWLKKASVLFYFCLSVSLRSGYKFPHQICPFIVQNNVPYFPGGKALQEKLPI